MKYILILFIFVFQSGCISSSSFNTQVLDGNLIQVGLFLPYNGSLYGIQCFQYISGRSTKLNVTNDLVSVHSISNKFNNEVYSLELKKWYYISRPIPAHLNSN